MAWAGTTIYFILASFYSRDHSRQGGSDKKRFMLDSGFGSRLMDPLFSLSLAALFTQFLSEIALIVIPLPSLEFCSFEYIFQNFEAA